MHCTCSFVATLTKCLTSLHCPSALFACSHAHVPAQLDHFMNYISIKKQTNTHTHTKARTEASNAFPLVFSLYPALSQGSWTQTVLQRIALPPSRRQQAPVEGQQLGQGSAEKFPKAVLSAKIAFNCPTILWSQCYNMV